MVSNSRGLNKSRSPEEESTRLEMRAKLREIVDKFGLRNRKIGWVTRKIRDESARELYQEHPELDNR